MRIAPVITLSPEQRTGVGVPSPEPLPSGASGGAGSHRPLLPPQMCTPAHATKANGIAAVSAGAAARMGL